MIHTYSMRLRIMIFGFLAYLWCWWIYHWYQAGYQQRYSVLFGLPLILVLIFATLLAIWSLSAIEASASEIRIMFLGVSILSFRWNDIHYAQKIVREIPDQTHPITIQYYIFSRNIWLPMTFNTAISDFTLLLSTINAAATEYGFGLYEETQGRSLFTRGILFERNRTPRGQIALRF